MKEWWNELTKILPDYYDEKSPALFPVLSASSTAVELTASEEGQVSFPGLSAATRSPAAKELPFDGKLSASKPSSGASKPLVSFTIVEVGKYSSALEPAYPLALPSPRKGLQADGKVEASKPGVEDSDTDEGMVSFPVVDASKAFSATSTIDISFPEEKAKS